MTNTNNYRAWHIEHAKVWEGIPSPARPSNGELNIFNKYIFSINKRNKLKVLILGSTPEFRDLCNNNKFETTCIDINEPIYKALTLLQKNPNRNEKFVCDNWLTFKTENTYDFIIGDAVTAMFGLEYYPQFFANMRNHLSKNGMLILRLPYQDPTFNIPMKTVMSLYRKVPIVQREHIYTATFNHLVMNYLDKKTSGISLAELGTKIEHLRRRGVISKLEYTELEKYYKNLTLVLYYPKEEYVLNAIKGYFHFVAKEFGLDYRASYSNPIFVFKQIP